MSINNNRIKVADLEKNQPNKTLITNENGELEFSDIIGGGSQDLNSVLNNGNYSSTSIILGSADASIKMDVSSPIGTTSINSGSINLTNNSTNQVTINQNGTIQKVENGNNALFSIPSKPSGTYKLAITDDITLQKALDNNNTAINTYFDLVNTDSDRTTRFNTSGMDIYTGNLYPEYVYDEDIRHYDGVSGSLQSIFNFRGLGNFNLPNKTIGYNYTLATLEDIGGYAPVDSPNFYGTAPRYGGDFLYSSINGRSNKNFYTDAITQGNNINISLINTSSTPFTQAALNATYPSAFNGFVVNCPSQGKAYVKIDSTNWFSYVITYVA